MLVNNVNSLARCFDNSDAINYVMAKKLEDWQIEDAARLRSIFEEKKPKSQQAFGEDNDIGTQGMVWQYLRAKRPLNIEVLIKFASGLKVRAWEISPTLWGKIESYFYSEARADDTTSTKDEERVLELMKNIGEGRDAWLQIGTILAKIGPGRRSNDIGHNPDRRVLGRAPDYKQKPNDNASRRRDPK